MIKQMLNPKNWLPHAAALSLAVVIYVVLTNFSSVWSGVRTFFGYFSPIILGCVIAYLVNPLAKMLERSVFSKVKKERQRKIFSNALAFVLVLAAIALLMAILIPQLIEGVSTFTSNLDSYLESLRTAFPGLNKSFGKFLNNPDVLASREKLLSALAGTIRNNADSLLEASALAGKSLIQWLIGLFLSVYLLAEKESLKASGRRLLRALLSEQRYEGLRAFLLHCDTILNRYVVFNLLDSLIIGGANAIFMAVMGIPYVGLVSFVVGVTNLIPTFGPMIGGAIGALLLCLVKLRYAVIFLIFTVLIQICDGYVIKPKLFGNSLGVSSLWILIGIIVGGRVFGAVGVLLAIPAVAVLDYLYVEVTLPRIEKRRKSSCEVAEGLTSCY